MKTTFRLIGAVATVAALFSSCKKEAFNEDVKPGTVEMTIIAGADDETRTVLGSNGAVTWSASGEQLAVMEVAVSGSGTTTAKVASKDGVIKDEGATMSFGVSMPTKKADSFVYYALYPNSAYVDKPSDFTNVKVNLASTQAPTESSFGPSADVLVAKPVTYQREQPTELNLQFARVIAVGKMTIKDLDTKENVKKVIFTATGKAVTGSSYIDFTTAAGVKYGYSSYGVDNVVLDYSDKTIAAKGMTAYFTCWPFELAAGDPFSVVVETDTYTFTKEITLTEGKSLAFKVGRASTFSVNFSGIKGVEKVVPDGAYVVAYDKNMMTVGTISNAYRGVATLPEKANDDGSYSVDATAAWNFVYDSVTDTYKISSASDNTLYIQGSSSAKDFKLVAQKSATSFTITKNGDGTYKISNGEYSIGMNKGTKPYRFAMYKGSDQQPISLNLYPAMVLPKIAVQETLEVPSAQTDASFDVVFTNVETADANAYRDADCKTKADWITVQLNNELTKVEYKVNENISSETRTAYIRIYALSPEANETTAIVTVTQAGKVSGTAVKRTKSISDISGATINGTKVSTMQLDENITLTASNGTNNGKVYSTGAEWRFYQTDKGTLTISAKSSCTLVSASITYTVSNSGILTYNSSAVSSGTSVSLSGSSAVFSVSDTSTNSDNGQVKITAITVTYIGGSSEGGSEAVKLDAPEVSCTAQTATSLTFSWDAVDKASGYQVSTDGGKSYGSTQTETTYTWTGLEANTSHTLYVKAIGDGTSYTDSDPASSSGTTSPSGSTGGEGHTHIISNEPIYTLSFEKLASGTNYNSYIASHTISASSVEWDVYGNQSVGDFLRVGGKNTKATDRTLTSKVVISSTKKIGKVSINHSGVGNGTNTTIKINSIKVESSVNSNFSDSKSVIIYNPDVSSSGSIDFSLDGADFDSNSYFKITINYIDSVSSGLANNSYIIINSIKFFSCSTN